MDRENFYLLLELSIEPPVEDEKQIDEAIRKMQAKWSRFRNHPTKAIQAKKFIGMLPEIRRVMLDAALRAEEAEAAVKLSKVHAEERFTEVDRHLAIHLSKGFITDDEITKLATLHHFPEDEIRERIRQTEEENYSSIDSQLAIRMGKGYITEDEIRKVAKTLSVAVEVVKKRVACPIKKDTEDAPEDVKPLEPAIEKSINDNLDIIGKTSLYDFLGIEPSSSLQLLQAKARKKESEVSKIARKDANVTASMVLVGHCMAIFQAEESRRSYDIARAKMALKALDADIDVAVLDGVIRGDYLTTLIKAAARFGLDDEDALDYIEDYCKAKGWKIEGEKKKKPPIPKKVLIIAGISALVILLIAAAFTAYYYNEYLQKKTYQAALEHVKTQATLVDKVNAWNDYIDTAPPKNYRERASLLKQDILDQIEKIDYSTVWEQAAPLIKQEKYEQAITAYQSFVDKHPKSPQSKSLNNEIGTLTDKIDERDFAAVERLAGDSPEKRMKAYYNYLIHHKKGHHVVEVRKYIEDMAEEYYLAIKRSIDMAAIKEDWVECIGYCDQYIRKYKNRRVTQLKKERAQYKINDRDKKRYDTLVAQAEALVPDYDEAMKIIKNFLMANPDTYLKPRAEKKIALYARKQIQARKEATRARIIKGLAASGKTFAKVNNDAIKDTRSGLMWTVLDSQLDGAGCLDYDAAKRYVKNLKAGGYRDWRLPTVKELGGIYKTKPFFPSWGDKWYWSSDQYRKYQDRWLNVVTVVTSRQQVGVSTLTKESWECGVVHAVRGK